MYSAFMYTDDFQDMLLGYDRFIRLLRVWFRVLTRLWGYRMAIARDRKSVFTLQNRCELAQPAAPVVGQFGKPSAGLDPREELVVAQ